MNYLRSVTIMPVLFVYTLKFATILLAHGLFLNGIVALDISQLLKKMCFIKKINYNVQCKKKKKKTL